MKQVFTLVFVFFLVVTVNANTVDEYYVDDAKIESLFASSTDISTMTISENALLSTQSVPLMQAAEFKAAGDNKNAAVAIVLNLFLGGLGIHRAYLGTKTFTWIGYILTCGGIGGIVPLIDIIVLIVNANDISQYVDNTKFFMW